jgi:beta-galactosidase/beta-glucuronidase
MHIKRPAALTIASLVGAFLVSVKADEYKPAAGPLLTRWAKDVSPDSVHPEHPRPQFMREDWRSLNGLWEYAITAKDAPRPEQFEGRILVPFPIESALSGVMKPVGPEQRLWYRRIVEIAKPKTGRLHLNFGAVDWETTVWINGAQIGGHRGGYDRFSIDITPALRDDGKQEIVIGVWDPSDAGDQPRGKQVQKPHGIWYTSVTGIWQSVWLETVPDHHLASLKIVPDIDRSVVQVEGEINDRRPRATGPTKYTASVYDGTKLIASRKAPAKAGSKRSWRFPRRSSGRPLLPFSTTW